MDPLFPPLPKDLSALSNEELQGLIDAHLEAQRLVREDNADFIGELGAVQVIEQLKIGKTQLETLRAEEAVRVEAEANYASLRDELTADSAALEADAGDDADDGNGDADADADAGDAGDAAADTDAGDADAVGDADAGDADSVTAGALDRPLRRPPAPDRHRAGGAVDDEPGAVLVAAAGNEGIKAGAVLDETELARVLIGKVRRVGKPNKHKGGTEERYMLASAQYRFPADRILTSDLAENARKIRALRNTEGRSLLASGGLCAPLTPIYSIPQFAVRDRPVRAALPSFNADRGGVNVPVPTTIGDVSGAITIITEANDALGGTFATKSCLDFDCPDFVETAVTIISHCREYGNLNARAWPESIAHENELTMAEHARISDSYLLDRIKAQSINVTTADVYNATHDFIYAIVRAAAGIRYRLRTGTDVRLRALLPSWVPDMLVADIAATQFERFVSRQRVTQILRDAGVEPTYYLDSPTTGTTQGFAAETAGALDNFPLVAQWALYVEGAFIHVDGGTLELGLVRDSTLNSTNDFQFFGETFENVALLGPSQSALWVTSTICPSGEFPALTTALACA